VRARGNEGSGVAGAIHYPAQCHEFFTAVQDESFWFKARNRLIVDLLRRHAGDLQSLIEVGCGTGFVLQAIHEAFPVARLFGLEPQAEGLAAAARRLSSAIELREGDIQHLDGAEAFDAVCAFDVLEHIDDDRAALAALTRVTRPGGFVFLTVPQHPWLWGAADELAQHRRRYRRRELEDIVAAAGLDVILSTSFVFVLLPAMFATRRLRLARPDQEQQLPRALGAVFERILDGERWLISAGCRLPIGGMRVVVARRGSAARVAA
jgi:SAM-dependent methyltransferase